MMMFNIFQDTMKNAQKNAQKNVSLLKMKNQFYGKNKTMKKYNHGNGKNEKTKGLLVLTDEI
jgi:hypothetical protein